MRLDIRVIFLSIGILTFALALFGCQTSPPSDGTAHIEGQAYVKLRGGETLKISSMKVYAVPTKKLNRRFDSLKVERLSYIDSASVPMARYAEKVDRTINPSIGRQNRDDKALLDSVSSRTRRYLRNSTAKHYYQNLPDAVDTTSTGANGNFEFTVPGDTSYYLIAKNRRKEDDRVELYYWKTHIQVSNDTTSEDLDPNNLSFVSKGSFSEGFTSNGPLKSEGYVGLSNLEAAHISVLIRSHINSKYTTLKIFKASTDGDIKTVPLGSEDWPQIMRFTATNPDTLTTL